MALDEATRARLLVDSGPSEYKFAHDLVREAILANLTALRRGELHLEVAKALELVPGEPSVELLALHWARAGDHERASMYHELAGDRAQARHAYSEAAERFRLVVTQLESLGRTLHGAQAREKLAAALANLPRYDEALLELHRALESYQAMNDVESQGRVVALLGHIHANRGTPEEGIGQIEVFLRGLDASRLSARNQAELHLELAHLHKIGGNYQQSLNAAEEAGAWSSEAWDHGLHAQAERARGTALLMLGRNVEGSAVMESAMRLLEAVGDFWHLAHALNNIAVVHESQGDFSGARLHLERAAEAAVRTGDPTLIAFMVHRCGINSFATGNWSQAREKLSAAEDILRDVGLSWVQSYLLRGLGMLEMAEGYRERATAHLEESVAIAQRMGDIQAQQSAHTLLAEHDLLEGYPEDVVRRLAPLLVRDEHKSDVSVLLPYLAVANDELGQIDQADALMERALRSAQTDQNRMELMNVLRAQALIAMRRGVWDRAEAACAQSLALSREMQIPHAELKVLYTFARLCHGRGELDRARTYLEEAKARCHQLGERFYGRHIERMLAELAQP